MANVERIVSKATTVSYILNHVNVRMTIYYYNGRTWNVVHIIMSISYSNEINGRPLTESVFLKVYNWERTTYRFMSYFPNCTLYVCNFTYFLDPSPPFSMLYALEMYYRIDYDPYMLTLMISQNSHVRSPKNGKPQNWAMLLYFPYRVTLTKLIHGRQWGFSVLAHAIYKGIVFNGTQRTQQIVDPISSAGS